MHHDFSSSLIKDCIFQSVKDSAGWLLHSAMQASSHVLKRFLISTSPTKPDIVSPFLSCLLVQAPSEFVQAYCCGRQICSQWTYSSTFDGIRHRYNASQLNQNLKSGRKSLRTGFRATCQMALSYRRTDTSPACMSISWSLV